MVIAPELKIIDTPKKQFEPHKNSASESIANCLLLDFKSGL